ncbi:MAG: phenylacetate--CoA ligase, partial [Microbacteriaceae bacterium]|nr:phenylacetate--CoA ligase [Microbacteriaceae bacterium]
LELTSAGRLDALTVRIEPERDYVGAQQAAATELRRRIKTLLGVSVEIKLEVPGALPRSEGKYKRLYDLR